ncbi:MAG: hypothetical protein EZS28_036269 [Streblomastix strix]|uniref:Uncharacterized protein n=1 Tax=Streblomastix strix TaxID=222440 RepID=A0A5J4UDA5_9EUKA|nr:MAG: hypothetical protein EZS28_036269 [Streblomastix strix]
MPLNKHLHIEFDNAIKPKFTGTPRNIPLNAVMFVQKVYGYPIDWTGAIPMDCYIDPDGHVRINTIGQFALCKVRDIIRNVTKGYGTPPVIRRADLSNPLQLRCPPLKEELVYRGLQKDRREMIEQYESYIPKKKMI